MTSDERRRRRRVRGDAADPGSQPDRPGSADPDPERGLRGLVGAGSTQLGVTAAMRVRDAARPTAEDLAAAERDLVIVRRHWQPPDRLREGPYGSGGSAPVRS